MNMGLLNWIFGACIVLAAVSVVIASMGFPVPRKTTAALICIAVGAAVLKVLMVKYLWIIVLVCAIGIALAGVVFVLTRINQLERRTGIDWNRDGKIGGPTNGKDRRSSGNRPA